jgi:hypothetical protein
MVKMVVQVVAEQKTTHQELEYLVKVLAAASVFGGLVVNKKHLQVEEVDLLQQEQTELIILAEMEVALQVHQ